MWNSVFNSCYLKGFVKVKFLLCKVFTEEQIRGSSRDLMDRKVGLWPKGCRTSRPGWSASRSCPCSAHCSCTRCKFTALRWWVKRRLIFLFIEIVLLFFNLLFLSTFILYKCLPWWLFLAHFSSFFNMNMGVLMLPILLCNNKTIHDYIAFILRLIILLLSFFCSVLVLLFLVLCLTHLLLCLCVFIWFYLTRAFLASKHLPNKSIWLLENKLSFWKLLEHHLVF